MLNLLTKKVNNRKGFTLIELIVVIAIIAILAAVLIPRFTGFTDNAREKSAISDTRNILLALEAKDSEDGLAASTSAADAKTIVQEYAGKDIIGTNTISAVTKGTDGLSFTFAKTIGSSVYTVTVADSVVNETVVKSS